jgi:hypothetical protein
MAASVAPEAVSVALVAASVAASVADHPALKRSYLLAPNSDFDDLGYFKKFTQRDTQPTKAFDPVLNGSKQYSTQRAIKESKEHRKIFLSSPSWSTPTPTPSSLQMCQHHHV